MQYEQSHSEASHLGSTVHAEQVTMPTARVESSTTVLLFCFGRGGRFWLRGLCAPPSLNETETLVMYILSQQEDSMSYTLPPQPTHWVLYQSTRVELRQPAAEGAVGYEEHAPC